jgi:hypothetical protein
LTLELLSSAIREFPSLGRQLTELRVFVDYDSESASTLMQVARLLKEDCFPALVELALVGDESGEDACAGAAALFECLGRGACPRLKHLSIESPSYAHLPLLADALVLRGEVVKGGLESFVLRDAQWATLEGIPNVELRAALAKLVQAPCLSKLQKLDLEEVALGPWAAAIYLNSTPCTDHIKELRIGFPACSPDEDGVEAIDGHGGVEDLVTALAAGMYTRCYILLFSRRLMTFFLRSAVCMTGRAPLLETLRCDRINVGEGTVDKLCNAISQGVLKHLERLCLTDYLNEEAAAKLTTAMAIGCPGLQALFHLTTWARVCQNTVVAAALRASQHPLLFYEELTLHEDAGLRDIVAALQTNPRGLSAVTCLKIGDRRPRAQGQERLAHEEVVTLVSRVMDCCPALQKMEMHAASSRALVAAMAPGGALAGGVRGIHTLSFHFAGTGGDVDATLRALVAGACPHLREVEFFLSVTNVGE